MRTMMLSVGLVGAGLAVAVSFGVGILAGVQLTDRPAPPPIHVIETRQLDAATAFACGALIALGQASHTDLRTTQSYELCKPYRQAAIEGGIEGIDP